MASRKLADLQDITREKAEQLLKRCEEERIDMLIYCTFRSPEEQAKLYWQGRALSMIEKKAAELRNKWGRPDLADLLMVVGPQEGPRMTNAGPGQSMHNYGLAFDAVPLRGGKPVWGTRRPEDKAIWQVYGRLGVEVGLEWAGNWSRCVEYPHMQEINVAIVSA